MAKNRLVREALILLVLVAFGAIVMVVGTLVASSLREWHLLRNGEASASHWTAQLESEPGEAQMTFARGRMLLPLDRVRTRIGDYSGPFRIELYDVRGREFFTSGNAAWPVPRLQMPIAAGDRDAPQGALSALHTAQVADRPVVYASVLVPFRYGGNTLGYVRAFVDLTEQADALTRSFRIIAAATAVLVIFAFGASAVIVWQKIRAHQRAQERIRYLSLHDELTGLPNRVAFNRRLSQALEQRRRSGGQVAVMFVDVDRFKDLNDSRGHVIGDAVLKALAARLVGSVREVDTVARHDGDEFAIAVAGLESAREAARLVERIGDVLRQPYGIDGELIECGVSIGIAMAPGDGEETDTLLRHADLALARAKESGRNAIRFFERGMDLTLLRRREREADLKRALERDEFDVLYQPQVWLSDERLCGHEALVRWRHPRHGKISPAYFISLAEETELIVPLGEWILRRACQDAAAWPDPFKVAVNLSPVQFRDGSVAAQLRAILDDTGLDPARLEVEITESLLMWDTETVLSELARLKDLGVTIAMDDFGTGYSSLSYLSRFPFGKIKIDRSFVRCMHSDEAVSAIVSCIVGLGRSLDVCITAEGVETAEQAAMLRKLGCHQGQGFLWGRPASAAEALKRCLEVATQFEAKGVA